MYSYTFPESFIEPARADVHKMISNHFVARHQPPLDIRPLDPFNPRISLERAAGLLSRALASGVPADWWIGVGTALGLARERGFIEGDTDIDIRIGLAYAGKDAAFAYAREIVDRFEANGFRLIRETFWNGLLMQTAFADETNDGVIVDIYYFYSGIYEEVFVNFNEHGFRRKPERLVRNKSRVTWPGHPEIGVYVPSPVEDYLEWRFGPEWRIKKKNSELGPIDTKCIEKLPLATVLTYGTFDLFHFGHKRLLNRARALGDQLVVGVVSDALCRVKGKSPWQNEDRRAEAVRRFPGVDMVFIQRTLDQKEFDIDRYGASFLVVGDDWANHPRFEAVRNYHGVELVYLPRTPLISTALKKIFLPKPSATR
ncbi:glycerol-3-phosphate cytidylyltransferase [Hoeflea marina]|uniref:Glycerol-3-phosphate cytidylyltransferase n=1 Tax=Hoeflea marina TaxID=274592 RepID=A0A317PJM4_9HYPH|nr:adenylyltransferase/cytidyltransferase family protein [Hoeflea marina]PWV98759.1 glycerol-3-phosphate cytidylyltransferase [Hoeflea marina]